MDPLFFSTSAYTFLLDDLRAHCPHDLGELERRCFPDGERYLRILSQVEGRDVVLVGGTVSDMDTLEMYDLACGLVAAGARRISLVIPFFGYSTMERAVLSGEIVTAKTRARLLSSIPTSSMGDRVLLLDLHVQGITHYFEGNMRPKHVYAKPVILAAARELGGEDFVLACTDAGRAKWVESLANDLGVAAAFVFKRRVSGAQTEVTGISAEVKGRRVVIYDDMIRTGGSLMGAARAYRAAGASSIAAIATHGLFPGEALDRLEASGLFERLITTDSHPRARSLSGSFLEVRSVAKVLADSLMEGGL